MGERSAPVRGGAPLLRPAQAKSAAGLPVCSPMRRRRTSAATRQSQVRRQSPGLLPDAAAQICGIPPPPSPPPVYPPVSEVEALSAADWEC